MITGDNPLTACHVAKELKFTQKPGGVVVLKESGEKWLWEDIEQTLRYPITHNYKELINKHDLCITGEVGTFLRIILLFK